MTEDTAVILCEIIRDAVAPDAWEVTLACHAEEYVDPDERTFGDCTWCWQARTARIRIAMGQPDRSIASTLLHELLHLATAELQAVHDRARDRLASDCSELQWESWRDAAERHVRALEKAFQPMLAGWLRDARRRAVA